MNITSPTEVTVWNPATNGVPPVTRVDEVRIAAFIEARRLGEYVDATVRLARDAFPEAKRITLSMFGEPGEYGERLVIEIATKVGVQESLRQYDNLVTELIANTPPWVTDRIVVTTDLS